MTLDEPGTKKAPSFNQTDPITPIVHEKKTPSCGSVALRLHPSIGSIASEVEGPWPIALAIRTERGVIRWP